MRETSQPGRCPHACTRRLSFAVCLHATVYVQFHSRMHTSSLFRCMPARACLYAQEPRSRCQSHEQIPPTIHTQLCGCDIFNLCALLFRINTNGGCEALASRPHVCCASCTSKELVWLCIPSSPLSCLIIHLQTKTVVSCNPTQYSLGVFVTSI